jgi:hypothetical protein
MNAGKINGAALNATKRRQVMPALLMLRAIPKRR